MDFVALSDAVYGSFENRPVADQNVVRFDALASTRSLYGGKIRARFLIALLPLFRASLV